MFLVLLYQETDKAFLH